MDEGHKRLATLVGCNYAGTKNELHGCINDVVAMQEVLINRFEFDPDNIRLLTDEDDSQLMPTGANIMQVLNDMIDQAKDGDVLYFHYSGHGTWTPKPNDSSQTDEAIVPCDFNLITDADFRVLVNRLPSRASFTILSDSCHSGGLIDKEKEQIGPSYATNTASDGEERSCRAIPYESVLEQLKSVTGIDSSDIGYHLREAFGDDASIKFRSSETQEEGEEEEGKEEEAEEDDLLDSLRHDAGILLSGCQANETSEDMSPGKEGGKAYGAFSNAIQMVLNSHERPLSNREVVTRARKLLEEGDFDQHPCLYCSDENADAPFLWQPEY